MLTGKRRVYSSIEDQSSKESRARIKVDRVWRIHCGCGRKVQRWNNLLETFVSFKYEYLMLMRNTDNARGSVKLGLYIWL